MINHPDYTEPAYAECSTSSIIAVTMIGAHVKHWTARHHGVALAITVLAVGTVGVLLLRYSSAATNTSASELEAGSVTSPASVVGNQAGASGNSSVIFGSAPTTDSCQPMAKSGGGTWQCSFDDEFNGNALSDTWSMMPYNLGQSCVSLQSPHLAVNGGVMRMTATKTATSGCPWTGSGIQSKGKFSQLYGRWEMRAKLPKQNLSWPAFWLLPDANNEGEIDIFETLGGDNEVAEGQTLPGNKHFSFTLHTPAGGSGPQKRCAVTPDIDGDYHTYAIEWTPGSMKMFIDGRQCAEMTGYSDNGTSPPGFPAVYTDRPYQILIDMQVQVYEPSWNIDPPDGSDMNMYVDYVRVWK